MSRVADPPRRDRPIDRGGGVADNASENDGRKAWSGPTPGARPRRGRSSRGTRTAKGRCCRSCTRCRHTFGHVPRAAIPVIAEALNLSRAEVYGVVTFYHDFRASPAGRHVVKLCRAEACQSMGGEALVARAEQRLGTACGTTSAGGVTLEAVYCLGLCATSPVGDGGRPPGGPARRGKARRAAGGGRGVTRVFVPRDAAAIACGADGVAGVIAAAACPALRWCATARAACSGWSRWSRSRTPAPATASARSTLAGARALAAAVASGTPAGAIAHPQAVGPVEAIPFFARQTRLTFARCGVTDPLSLDGLRGAWRLGRPAPRAATSAPRRSSPR